ncbi:MAG: hypothetical protein M3451_05225 [Chloroflexota bacterium]|nr:hypothetical protein [Chloroflexota bacterium]
MSGGEDRASAWKGLVGGADGGQLRVGRVFRSVLAAGDDTVANTHDTVANTHATASGSPRRR